MLLSRRGFLRGVPVLLSASLIGAQSQSARAGRRGCLLLDCECALRESFEGFIAGLRASKAPFEIARQATATHAPVIIVPAASLSSTGAAVWLRRRVEAGATVLIESGGAFISRSRFARQQTLARSQFKLDLAQPARLWKRPDDLAAIPYVDLTWPIAARLRDFSRVVAVSGIGAEVIGRIGGPPDHRSVAVKRHLGSGVMVFLGSPVGPQLLAGDREAQGWLDAVTRSNQFDS